MRTSVAKDRKTGQRGVILAYEILFLFFGTGIVRLDVMNDIFQSLTMCTLIIKQVLPKYSDSYTFNWHSKFADCLTWPKVDVLPYLKLFSSYFPVFIRSPVNFLLFIFEFLRRVLFNFLYIFFECYFIHLSNIIYFIFFKCDDALQEKVTYVGKRNFATELVLLGLKNFL